MRPVLVPAATAVAALLLANCAQPPGARVPEAETSAVERQSGRYQQVADEFTGHATRGNVDAMMRLTSHTALGQSGPAKLRSLYENQVVPKFRGAGVSWKSAEQVVDEYNRVGYEFHGIAQGARKSPFTVYVFNESGTLRASIGLD